MTLAFTQHDHKLCQNAHMDLVVAICARKGLRLTPIRARVLAMLLENHCAMGAYEILAALAREGEQAQPPIVYRALAFLTENGFAHKIEQLNAYAACHFPEETHNAGFFICRECKQVGECCVTQSPFELAGFQIESQVFEVKGLCQNCQETGHE